VLVAQKASPGNGVWTFNATEVMATYVSTDAAEERDFVAHGMPLARFRADLPGGPVKMYTDPVLMSWVESRFQSTYGAWLLEHLPATVWDPLTSTAANVSLVPTQYGTMQPVLPDPVASLIWGGDGGEVLFGVALVLVLAAVCIGRRVRVRSLPLALLLLTSAALMSIDTYWFATGEYPRLFAPVGVLSRVGLAVSVALCLDALRVAL